MRLVGRPCSSSVCEAAGCRLPSHSSSLQNDSHWNLCSKMWYHMQDLRFSHWCRWRSKSPMRWCQGVDHAVSYVSRDHNAFRMYRTIHLWHRVISQKTWIFRALSIIQGTGLFAHLHLVVSCGPSYPFPILMALWWSIKVTSLFCRLSIH
jgi:hypothetical protein